MNYLTEQLSSNHPKSKFDCGVDLLNTYLHKQAKQDIRRKLSACFVMFDKEAELLKGYYTLSNSSIPQDMIPNSISKKLPNSYDSIPTTLLGRLAVDTKYKGQGVGEALLVDALKRSYYTSVAVGSFAVIVDPFDEGAIRFYEKYGFIQLPDSGKMFIPMKTVQSLFN